MAIGKPESVIVKKSQRIQREMLKLSQQLDKAVARVKVAEAHKQSIVRKLQIKSEELRIFLSQYTAH